MAAGSLADVSGSVFINDVAAFVRDEKLDATRAYNLSKEALIKRVLGDEGLSIYECGREDIASGRVDRGR